MHAPKYPIVSLMGPTGTGKTQLAMMLADHCPCHLISIDAVMIYRGMDIGAAKPDRATRLKYPHALVDILDPTERYSVHQCVTDVAKEIAIAQKNDAMPVLVGGTMMYHHAIQFGMHRSPPSTMQARKKVKQMLQTHGLKKLWEMLDELDPKFASGVMPTDTQRILRGHEMLLHGHTLPSEWLDGSREVSVLDGYQTLTVVLKPYSRTALYQRLNDRFDAMMAEGLLEETRNLIDTYGVLAELPAFRAVGYRQLSQHIVGQCDLVCAANNAKTATRRLAKRQLTWLNRWQDVSRCEINSDMDLASMFKEISNRIDPLHHLAYR